MVNPFRDINWRPGPEERRAFGRSLMIGFPILAGAFAAFRWWSAGEVGLLPAVLAFGGWGLGAICRFVPAVAGPFYLGWYGLAACIGFVVTNLSLVLFYYGAMTPIGLGLRLAGRDGLRRRLDREAPTYWEDVAVGDGDPEQYYRQF